MENEQREYLEARRDTYLFLSNVFLREVPTSFLENLAANAETYEGLMGEYALSLREADLEKERLEVGAVFAKLLLSMSANPVTPYESVYLSGLHLLMQESRDQVVAFYQANGFKCVKEVRLPEDHVGIEFEFMAALCQKEIDALEACDAIAAGVAREAQKAFVRDHLVKWVPQLCDDILVRVKSGFYAGIAETTKQFLELEAEEFELA